MKAADTIFHQTRTKPKFRDRIKILLGATLIIDSEIDVDQVVTVLRSKTFDSVTFYNEYINDDD